MNFKKILVGLTLSFSVSLVFFSYAETDKENTETAVEKNKTTSQEEIANSVKFYQTL